MIVLRLRNTVYNLMIVCAFLVVSSLATTKLLTMLPPGLQPSVFMLLCIVYWLMLDNITFSTDLAAAEMRTLLHLEAEKTATKIAVAAVVAEADSTKNAGFRKRATSFIVK